MSFTHGHMIAYFVDRKASDNLPARDIKSISDQAYALSERGHIQNIELATDFGTNYIRAKCLPEMKKTIIYSLRMVLKDDCSIVGAECGCPAGKGPAASCKHIAALCYSLDKFCKSQQIPQLLSPTNQLQTWNQPRAKKLKPVSVQNLHFEKLKYGKKPRQQHKPLTSVFDPRPLRYRHQDHEALAHLQSELAQMPITCFLHLLGPATDPVACVCHDHSYARTSEPPAHPLPRHTVVLPLDSDNIIQLPVKEKMERFKQEMTLSPHEIKEVERNTRAQSDSPMWFEKRRYRITASACGKILQRPTRATAREILYPKPFVFLPAPILWGRQHEKAARKKYEEVKTAEVGRVVETKDCGLYVHPYHGWLAATPDATVHSNAEPDGILEVKCPYTERENHPLQSCTNPNFYGTLCNGNFKLKREHNYNTLAPEGVIPINDLKVLVFL